MARERPRRQFAMAWPKKMLARNFCKRIRQSVRLQVRDGADFFCKELTNPQATPLSNSTNYQRLVVGFIEAQRPPGVTREEFSTSKVYLISLFDLSYLRRYSLPALISLYIHSHITLLYIINTIAVPHLTRQAPGHDCRLPKHL